VDRIWRNKHVILFTVGLLGIFFLIPQVSFGVMIVDRQRSVRVRKKSNNPNRFSYGSFNYSGRKTPKKRPCKPIGLARCLGPKKLTYQSKHYNRTQRPAKIHPYLRNFYKYNATQNY